jgi:hypothetical protein
VVAVSLEEIIWCVIATLAVISLTWAIWLHGRRTQTEMAEIALQIQQLVYPTPDPNDSDNLKDYRVVRTDSGATALIYDPEDGARGVVAYLYSNGETVEWLVDACFKHMDREKARAEALASDATETIAAVTP